MASSLDFLFVMAALYLVECLRRVGPDELTLDRRLRSGFQMKQTAPYPNRARWGWVLLNPFRPDGPTFSLISVKYGLADGETDVARVKNVDAERFDIDKINEAYAKLSRESSGIRRIALALLVVCFGLFPASVLFLGLRRTLLPAAAVAFMASMHLAIQYRRKERLFAPCMSELDLYGHMVKLALYPISAIRCMDALSRDLLAAFDPIAVTTVLCGRKEAARLAAKEMMILRFGVTPQATDSTLLDAMAEYRAARLQFLESFVIKNALPVQAIIEPPIRLDETCRSYCPVCGAQFTLSEGRCVDCPDIVLQPILRRTEK